MKLHHLSTSEHGTVSDLLGALRVVAILVCAMCVFAGHGAAQTDSATLEGTVFDPSGAVVPNTVVEVTNDFTKRIYVIKSSNEGIFTIRAIPPGSYTLRTDKAGFEATDEQIVLHTADRRNLTITLVVGRARQSVTVNAASITNDSPAVSMTVTHEFIQNMPLNGRSFQDLIQLAPGVVSSGGTDPGYYSIDGQRTDANNYTVDGVSANLGGYLNLASPMNNFGSGLAGASPSQTALGTTQALASVDALQEFTIQTSGYMAEYGRTPGGQIQFTTRSGTSQTHGSLFEYIRNTALDANSYYNNYYGLPRTAEHQNDFGGTLGGPLRIPRLSTDDDTLFYFLSYEGLRLLLPAFESEYVPTMAFRNWASPNVRPFLNAAPLPSPDSSGNPDGCTIPDSTSGQPVACDALFNYSYSYPNNLDSTSIRLDRTFGPRFHLFIRYADTPSSKATGAELISKQMIASHGWTAGLTAMIGNNIVNEFRTTFSYDGETLTSHLRPLEGSLPWASSLLIPARYESPFAVAYPLIQIPGTSLQVAYNIGGDATIQHQYQLVDSIAWTHAHHSQKFGVDWRRLTPTAIEYPYESIAEMLSMTSVQQGIATAVIIKASAPGKPVLDNLSLYGQDHWRINSKLSVDYGLRWEFNPPPGPSNGKYPVSLTSNDLATADVAPLGTPPYKANYHSLAPRFGFSWNAIPSREHPLTIRGAFGIFFDTGQTRSAAAYFNDYPFIATRNTQSNVVLPLSDSVMAPPSLDLPIHAPYPNLYVSTPTTTLPYTEQWNLTVDEALGAKNVISMSYVGNNGKKLLFTQYYNHVPNNPAFTSLYLTHNGSHSSYNALHIQDTGRIASNLDIVASAAFAHALDDASSDYSAYAPIYGNSDYDLRRTVNVAINYHSPTIAGSGWMRKISHNWLIANRFSAQSGYPLNLVQSTTFTVDGMYSQYSPDIVPNARVYLHGAAAGGGGWRINRGAFACTTNGATSGPCPGTPTRQGTLGRNFLRQPSFWAFNSAAQRSFPLGDRMRLNFRAEAFNTLNHPNRGGPNTALSSALFGQLSGGTTTIGSSNALYSMGAARSLQLSLHLQF